MFTKTPPNAPPVPAQRIRAIAATKPPVTYDSDAGPRPRPQRRTVYREAVAILPQGGKLPVLIRNMSDKGLRIEQFWSEVPSGRILIVEPNTPMHCWADIIWQTPRGACGLRIVA